MNYILSFSDKLHLPSTYLRNFEHDLPPGTAHLINRIALLSLPFLALYAPLGATISITMGSARAFTHLKEMTSCISKSETLSTASHCAQVALAVAGVAAVAFNLQTALLITSFADTAASFYKAITHIHHKDYPQAIENLTQAAASSLYLAFMLSGTLEVMLASILLQASMNFVQAASDFKKGAYPEAVAKLLMGGIRLKQASGQIELIKEREAHAEVERALRKRFVYPSETFNKLNPPQAINAILNRYGATPAHKKMLQEMINNEDPGFFGYHAGSSEYRIFQDVIRIIVEEHLQIPVREDFQFLRTPCVTGFRYESAKDFITKNPVYHDSEPQTRKHIMSLNMALYKSWDAEWDFTPRYYLQNQPWTHVSFEGEISPFFHGLGIDTKYIRTVFNLARKHVPNENGMILQFFDNSHKTSEPYAFLNEQAYIGTSTGMIPKTTPSEYFIDSNKNEFPQLRLVLNSETLNQNAPLSINRFSMMNLAQERAYDQAMRSLIRTLVVEESKATVMRSCLLEGS